MNDILWAPWRLAYVVDDDADKVADVAPPVSVLPDGDAECFLCQAVADSHNKARLVINRTEWTVTVLNKFPYNNGHLLITPKRHISRLDLLTVDERNELFERITFWVSRLESSLHPDGFNVGLNLGQAAGAGLPGHLHWHIVPRWSGDVNYMTSVASTKVIPQALEALWELISVVGK
jgi:ATP adenylyltransferase